MWISSVSYLYWWIWYMEVESLHQTSEKQILRCIHAVKSSLWHSHSSHMIDRFRKGVCIVTTWHATYPTLSSLTPIILEKNHKRNRREKKVTAWETTKPQNHKTTKRNKRRKREKEKKTKRQKDKRIKRQDKKTHIAKRATRYGFCLSTSNTTTFLNTVQRLLGKPKTPPTHPTCFLKKKKKTYLRVS